jgi:hypothetical protein
MTLETKKSYLFGTHFEIELWHSQILKWQFNVDHSNPVKNEIERLGFALKKYCYMTGLLYQSVFHLFQCLVIFSHLLLYRHIIMRTDLRRYNDSLLRFGLKCNASLSRFLYHDFLHFSDPPLKKYQFKKRSKTKLSINAFVSEIRKT